MAFLVQRGSDSNINKGERQKFRTSDCYYKYKYKKSGREKLIPWYVWYEVGQIRIQMHEMWPRKKELNILILEWGKRKKALKVTEMKFLYEVGQIQI